MEGKKACLRVFYKVVIGGRKSSAREMSHGIEMKRKEKQPRRGKKQILSTPSGGYCTFNSAIFILLHYHFTHNYDCFSCIAAMTTSGRFVRTPQCTNLFFVNILSELHIRMQNSNRHFRTNGAKTHSHSHSHTTFFKYKRDEINELNHLFRSELNWIDVVVVGVQKMKTHTTTPAKE